ncbi:MAG: response regulator, partial [Bacteroidota bacterium]
FGYFCAMQAETITSTILVLDDQRMIGKVIEHQFKTDFNVEFFTEGLAAMTWLEEGNIPAAMIIDLYIPEMDGFEFIEKVKQMPFLRNIPLIVLSSETSSSVKIAVLKAGADDFLSKPFHPEELLIRLGKLLRV